MQTHSGFHGERSIFEGHFMFHEFTEKGGAFSLQYEKINSTSCLLSPWNKKKH